MNAVVATITPKASAEIIQHLAMLFAGYDVPFGDGSETRKAKVAGYVWACEDRSSALVERVVKDFLSGKVKRSPSLRSKLPTSEEFAAQMDARMADGDRALGEVAATYAPPFGPLWMAKLLARLLAGPDADMRKPSRFVASMIAKGGEEGDRYRREHQANNGFRKASAMLASADDARGCCAEQALTAFSESMEPVPVEGAVFLAWRDEFSLRGWPWLPNTGKQRVVYFPKGGPAGLDQISAALVRAGGGSPELLTSVGNRRGEVSA